MNGVLSVAVGERPRRAAPSFPPSRPHSTPSPRPQLTASLPAPATLPTPPLPHNRRDTAILLDKTGQGEAAIDYATGALVNAQVCVGIRRQHCCCNHSAAPGWPPEPLPGTAARSRSCSRQPALCPLPRLARPRSTPPRPGPPPCVCLLQTLAGIMSGQQRTAIHPILEPFYRLLADLKQKVSVGVAGWLCVRVLCVCVCVFWARVWMGHVEQSSCPGRRHAPQSRRLRCSVDAVDAPLPPVR